MSKRKRSLSAEDSIRYVSRRRTEEILQMRYMVAMRQLPHSIFPAFNVCNWPASDGSNFEEYPTCSFSPPRPVFISPMHCPAIDSCHKRMMAQESYERRLFTARTRYQAVKKSNKSMRSLENKQIYHSSVFEVAERLATNPNPFLTASYDFYYTDGSLCVLPEKNIVLHTSGADLKNLNFSVFPQDKPLTIASLRCTKSVSVDEKSEIFATKPLKSMREGFKNCFAVRYLKNISLLCKADDTLTPIAQFRNKAAPFISFAQSSYEPNIFVITTMKQHVRLYDLNVSEKDMKSMWLLGEERKKSSWNIIKSWRENSFLYANEKRLVLMDIRTKPEEWLKTCDIPPYDPDCESISALATSEFKNLIYVGTSHKLHCLDVRFITKHFEYGDGAICRWTHQMDYPPAFIDTYRNGVSEFIAVGSALADDLRICELQRKGNLENLNGSVSESTIKTSKRIYVSNSLPYQPPTLQEAFDAARLAGKCLQADANMKDRIKCSRTGLAFYTDTSNHDSRTILLSSNSCGEVYASNLDTSETRSFERSNELSNGIMAKYEKKILRIPQPQLKYTEIVNAKALKKILCCEALNTSPNEDLPDMKPRRLGRWQRSLRSLNEFKDLLAKEILQIWDIEVEDEIKLNLTQFSAEGGSEQNKADYVKSWLFSDSETHQVTALKNKNSNTINEKISTNENNISQTPQKNEEVANVTPQLSQEPDEIDKSILNLQDKSDLNAVKSQISLTTLASDRVLTSSKKNRKKLKHFQGF